MKSRDITNLHNSRGVIGLDENGRGGILNPTAR